MRKRKPKLHRALALQGRGQGWGWLSVGSGIPREQGWGCAHPPATMVAPPSHCTTTPAHGLAPPQPLYPRPGGPRVLFLGQGVKQGAPL